MATIRWIGRAASTAQVNHITPMVNAIGDQFIISISKKSVTYTAVTGSVSAVISGLLSLLEASNEPEFQEVRWQNGGNKIIATARTPGVPFTQTSDTTGGSTLVTTTVTPNRSPNDVADADNWSPDGLPGNGDVIVLDNGSVSLLWNLHSLAAISAEIVRRPSFAGAVGLPEWNPSDYHEYRPTYLRINASSVVNEMPSGGGETFKLDVGSTQCALIVRGGGAASDGTAESSAVWFRGTNANNTILVDGSSIALAARADDSAAAASVNAENSSLFIGASASLASVRLLNCTVNSYGSLPTLVQTGDGSVTTIRGAATIGTAHIRDGRFASQSNGTIATIILGTDGVFAKEDAARQTVTNAVVMHRGASWLDPYGAMILTDGFRCEECRLEELGELDFGIGRKFIIV